MTRPYFFYSGFRYIIDALALLLSFTVARFYSPDNLSTTSDTYQYLFILFSVVAWYISAQASRLYTDLRSNKFSQEIIYTAFTLILHAVILTSFLFFIRHNLQFKNNFLALYFSVLFFLIISFKYTLRKYLHSIFYTGKLQDKIILVGSTPAAKDFYDTINYNYYYGYKCIGFLEDEKVKLNGCPYLGEIKDLNEVLDKTEVDEVIIALPNSKHEQITSCIEACDFHAKRVRMIPDLNLYASSNIQINTIGLLPVINLRSLPQDIYANRVVKRIFDVLFSISFFVLFGWWLMPITALLIKLT